MEAVDSLDIAMLLDSYRVGGKGELPYDPTMMLRVLIYAYATGTFSSRRIESQLSDSIAFRVLAGNQTPGFRSISRFRARPDRRRGLSRFGTQIPATDLC